MAQGRPRVLLVEDDLEIRQFLQDALADEGFDVRAAPTGRAGLLDLRMPDMNGWEVRAQQRALPDLAGIPVILTTAVASPHENLQDLAPAAVVHKPFDLDELLETVRRCLGEP